MANEKSRFEINGTSYDLNDAKAVKFDRTQSLTTAQKQKARENIGALGVDNVYNGLDKTAPGYALDARQGKVLNDQINATQSDIAIIIEGNQTTHTGGVAVGEYVIVRNSTISGITDGLYKAVQAIPANTAIDSTYLATVDGGLGSEVAALNSKIAKSAVAVAFVSNVSADTQGRTKCYKHGDSVILNYAIESLTQATGYTTVMNIPPGYRPSNYIYGTANSMRDSSAGTSVLVIGSNGDVQLKLNGQQGTIYSGSISWTI